MMLMISHVGDPTFFLVVRRRLDYEVGNSVRRIGERGDIDAMITLFDKRIVSPNDQDQSGYTLLHVGPANISCIERLFLDEIELISYSMHVHMATSLLVNSC